MPKSPLRRASNARPRLAFFFGAGAEVSYGLPFGGQFALEVLKGAKDQVAAFKTYRNRIANECSDDYRGWLPERFATKQVSSLTGTDQGRVFEDSLASGFERIIETLDDYDTVANGALSAIGWTEQRVARAFEALSGKVFGEHVYSKVKIKRSIAEAPARLFTSKYFSAILDLTRDSVISDVLADLARSTNQIYLGAHGQGTMLSMTDSPLLGAPEDNPAFQELGSMFQMHALDAGVSAFKAVMAHRPQGEVTDITVFPLLATLALESAVERFLDYRSIVDDLLPALFKPRDAWGKFTKIFTFLMGAREYMHPKQRAGLEITRGYYHDLAEQARKVTITTIGTSNYTSLCGAALADAFEGKVVHLNGSLDEYLDPYKNELAPQKAQAETPRFLVPFLFTQSGIKPLTSVEVSRRYVDFYDAVVESDAAIVAGFGFNADDGHINSLFRQAIDRTELRVVVLKYSPTGLGDAEDAAREMAKTLRVSSGAHITVLPVNGDRKTEGRGWLEAALDALS